MLFQDARVYQIVFLSLFLFLGISRRDWTVRPDLIGVVIISCILTQIVFSVLLNLTQNKTEVITVFSSLQSAIITGLGLCLLLRANHYQTMALAGCLAIASKFIFRFRDKHFFNPANFGIISVLIITPDAWVSPGQWGTDWWYLLLFLGTGGIVLKKVGRWDTSVAFLFAYLGLEFIRNCWLGWSWDVLLHQLSSGSLLLFALFMLSDPRSIPNAITSRLIWSISIAGLTFILQHIFYLPTAIFWALFILSPLTLILDYLWYAPIFSWKTNVLNHSLT